MTLALLVSILALASVVSDTTIWSITYDCHYDDRNSFVIQATGKLERDLRKYIRREKSNQSESDMHAEKF